MIFFRYLFSVGFWNKKEQYHWNIYLSQTSNITPVFSGIFGGNNGWFPWWFLLKPPLLDACRYVYIKTIDRYWPLVWLEEWNRRPNARTCCRVRWPCSGPRSGTVQRCSCRWWRKHRLYRTYRQTRYSWIWTATRRLKSHTRNIIYTVVLTSYKRARQTLFLNYFTRGSKVKARGNPLKWIVMKFSSYRQSESESRKTCHKN